MEGFIRPINDEVQYERAISRIFRLMHEKLTNNSPEKKELKKLCHLVDNYEKKYYPNISAL